jgi:proteasome activator subunit 4
VDYVFNFNSASFRLIIPDQIQQAMDEVASMGHRSISDFEQQMQRAKAKVAERHQNETKAYGELITSLLEILKDPKVHWRFANMAANFLELLLRSDAPPSAELVEFATNCIVSELPAMRKIGISSTSRILLYIKQRTFAQGDDEILLVKETQNPRKHLVDTPQPLPAGYTDNFLEESWTPISDISKCDLVDNVVTGWYVWPKSYQAYSLEPPNSGDIEIEEACRAGFEEFRKAYTSWDFWSKIAVYMSQETSKGQEDAFSGTNARLYKSIFGMFLDEPLETAKVEIERLCSQVDQKNQQRAAAELVAGIIRGSKHWSLDKTEALWAWLGPLLRKTFAAITPDSLTYWEGMVKFCASQRDPRRLLPLVDVILSAEFDPTSYAAFSEARKLLFVRALLTTMTWRALPKSTELLDIYFDNLHHPYKQVREAIGGNINEILQIQWVPSIGSVKELLAFNQSSEPNAATIPISIQDPLLEEKLTKVIENLKIWRQEIEPTATAGSTKYANASKTVLCWLHEALSNWRVAGTYPHILPLLPELFHMQDINDDHDLQTMASGVLNLIAQTSYPHTLVPQMVDTFAHILTESNSWHIRMKALPILQVFFFKHLFLLQSSEVIRIMDVITDLLMDTQIEVRQLASVTLSGLVRCSQRDAIHVLKKKYTDLVVNTRIPKRIRQPNGEKAPVPEGFQEALLKKHAGVLGLSSLVDAFPYEVPQWMPQVLVLLAGCISEPATIQVKIRVLARYTMYLCRKSPLNYFI